MTALALLLSLFSATPEPPFPHAKNVTFWSNEYFAWSEADFPLESGENAWNIQKGKNWNFQVVVEGMAEDAPAENILAVLKPPLLQAGWVVVKEWVQNPPLLIFRNQKNGKDAWLSMMPFSARDTRVALVDVGPQPLKLDIKPPDPKAPKLADTDDFPYLPPLPKSVKGSSSNADGAFTVSTGPETTEIVGTSSMTRNYKLPDSGLSPLQVATIYVGALKKAGWTIHTESHGIHQSDSVVIARYQKDSRTIWAYIHGAGEDYAFNVADSGNEDMAAKLAKDCRVPLYGVFFDFDKATLKPESNAVLSQARDALKVNARLKVEVQGHTDNVGNDAYNQKLSGERAAAVVAWLTKAGIPAAQLTSKGYGKSRPVESNDSPEGRAKNRRVELACNK